MIPEQIKDRLPSDLIFLGYRGSQAHGMFVPKNDPNSIDDIDLMGVHFASTNHYLGFPRLKGDDREDYLASFPDEWDIVSYEFRKFVGLLMESNPNVLSMLWLEPESVLFQNDVWDELVQNRNLFVSKLAGHSFAGYANSQLKKMTHFNQAAQEELIARAAAVRFSGGVINDETGEAHLPPGASASLIEAVRQYRTLSKKYFDGYMGNKRKQLVLKLGYDAKNAAHLIRLLRMALEFLDTGEMIVKRPDAQELLSIKQGNWTLDEVQQHATNLFARVNVVRERSTLPEQPDRENIEKLMVAIMQRHLFEPYLEKAKALCSIKPERKSGSCFLCNGAGFVQDGCFGSQPCPYCGDRIK